MSLIVTSTSHNTSVLNGLLTPSRDLWESIILEEIRDVLDSPECSVEDQARILLALVERERTRHIGEER